MWNPGLVRTNRKARRRAARYNGEVFKDNPDYRPIHYPISLGINQYKREHPGESKRIAYYKENMWQAWKELKSEQS